MKLLPQHFWRRRHDGQKLHDALVNGGKVEVWEINLQRAGTDEINTKQPIIRDMLRSSKRLPVQRIM